jgi:hypothetical protein
MLSALFTAENAAAQRSKSKSAPTAKKAATDKKTPAKTKATPDSKSKSSKNEKNKKETASKNKSNDRRNEKNDRTAKNDRNSKNDRSKNSREDNRKTSKQKLAANNRIPSRNERNSRNERTAKNDRSARNDRDDRSDRNKNSSVKNSRALAAEKSRRLTASKNTRSAEKTNSRRTLSSKAKRAEDDETEEPPAEKTVAPIVANNAQSEIIVASFSVPVRSQASQSAPLLSNVRLGSVLRVAEKKPEWYKVQYFADGRNTTGWVPANAVNDLNASGRSEIYRQIVERNYKPQMDFEAASEFYEFTSKLGNDLDGSDKAAEIELKRLLALRSALRTIPADRRETAPYRDFLKAQEKEIVYNEPAGEWLVVSNEFWSLHNKYKKTNASEMIAWEAANNPLPGECEGYVNCYLFDMRMRFGEYLNLHPNGARAGEALKNITDYLAPLAADAAQKTTYNGPTDVTDRAEFNNLIAELRTIVARLPFVEKEKTLQQLRTIAEAYR